MHMLALHGFPEVGHTRGNLEPATAVRDFGSLGESVLGDDPEDALVLPDRCDGVEDVDHPPAERVTHEEHPDGALKFVAWAAEILDRVRGDLHEFIGRWQMRSSLTSHLGDPAWGTLGYHHALEATISLPPEGDARQT